VLAMKDIAEKISIVDEIAHVHHVAVCGAHLHVADLIFTLELAGRIERYVLAFNVYLAARGRDVRRPEAPAR
jgi:hypothetical protein